MRAKRLASQAKLIYAHRLLTLFSMSLALLGQGANPTTFDVKSLSIVSAKSLAHKMPNAARKELQKGFQALHNGRYDQARAHLSEAVRLDPASVEAQADLGVADASTGNLTGALDHFEHALALDPNQEVLYEDKANVLMLLNRFADAEQPAREALRRAPHSVNANYTLGMSLIRRGMVTPEAVACIKLAAAKDPRARPAAEMLQHMKR